MDQNTVALAGSFLLLAGVIYTAYRGNRSQDTKVASEAASTTLEQANEALEKAWEQRLAMRDEKIDDLKSQLTDTQRQLTEALGKIDQLTAMVVSLGGVPNGS